MMRKDVRIGFAIGGVLLAVLIVYGLVTSGPSPRNHEVTLAPDDPAASKNPNQANQPAAEKSEGAAPQTADRSGGTDATGGNAKPRAGGETASNGNGSVAANPAASPTTAPADKWERALNHGMLMVTETPSLGAAPAQPDQEAGGAQPTPPAPAVTEGTTSGAAGTSGTNAGDLAGGNSADTSTAAVPVGNSGNASNAGGGQNSGTGAIDARVLADIAAGGSGTTTPSAGNASSGNSTAAPPTGAAGASGQRTHVVQPNETFASIAEVAYGSQAYYPHLVRANPSVNPKKLRAGMTIVLPEKEQVVAKETAKAPPQGAALSSPSGSPTPGAAGASSTTGSTHLTGPSGAVTVALAPIDEKTQYRVQAGESLYKISMKLYGRGDKVNAIYDLNKDAIGPNRNQLKAGSVLKLPEPPTAGGATAAR